MSFKPRAATFRHYLATGLGLAVLIYLLPFLPQSKLEPENPPDLAWAPGYWEISPLLGIVRIVPLARATLVNPAAQAVPESLLTNLRDRMHMPETGAAGRI